MECLHSNNIACTLTQCVSKHLSGRTYGPCVRTWRSALLSDIRTNISAGTTGVPSATAALHIGAGAWAPVEQTQACSQITLWGTLWVKPTQCFSHTVFVAVDTLVPGPESLTTLIFWAMFSVLFQLSQIANFSTWREYLPSPTYFSCQACELRRETACVFSNFSKFSGPQFPYPENNGW